jgi:hydrophobic/amphiphilic exporter-1 (mainly G- bacteria), HAE1 family
MNLSAPFIKRPVMTTLAMVAILFTGLLCYYLLPISSMPNVNFPTINVKATFPGALPETMASSVALPMEKQFMAIPGLRIVSSNNTLGNTSIVLQFDIDKDMLIAAQDVQEAVSAALPYLPPTIPYGPVYRKVNPASQPVIILGLTSPTAPRYDLYTYGNTLIGQRISMLPGVSQVTTYGSILAVRIQTDPAKMVNHNITLTEVATAVQLENVFLATGQLDGTIEAPIIAVDGEVIKAEDYNKMVVAYRNGTPVRIEDIGNATTNFQNNKILGQYVDEHGAEPTVVLAVQKEPGANTVDIANGIYQLLEQLKTELPPSIEVHVVFDHSVPVRGAISDAITTLILALILVVLVIYLFLGKIGDTIIPSLVLPMSVIGTFIVMYALNFTLDNLSVLALTLAVGFIIDDAVVVLENIIRRVEKGESPLQAALEGSKEIGFTIVSMSLSLLAVFIPMLFMGGLIGKIFSEFAITLAIITILSGLISLTLTPMLCSKFIPPREKRGESMPVMERFAKKMNEKMSSAYHKMLLKVFDHQLLALTTGLLCLIATFFLFYYLPTDFVPNDDVGFFAVYTQEREGGSSGRMLSYTNEIIEILKNDPAVDDFVALSSYSEYRKGLNYVHLKPEDQRKPIVDVIQGIYKKLKDVIGVQAFIKNIPLIDLAIGQEARSAYQYALQGIQGDALYRSAGKILEKMRADPLFQGVNSDMEVTTPQVNVNILRDQAAQYGLSATDVENAFNLSYSGGLISLIQTPVDQYNVILELYPELQRSPDTLNEIWLRSPFNAELVPLAAVASWTEGLGATSINHINQFPAVTLSFNLAPNVPLETALDKLNHYAEELVEPGVTAKAVGAAQSFNESIKSSGYLLILTIFSIYIILGILYESFIHPITILTTLPPATFGGLVVLLIFGMPLSMYSFLGIILLIGIVKKNGIMIVDFAIENIRLKGMPAKEAIIDACMVRFRPIMMTTAAAIFGVLPIALGYGTNAAAKRPLGLVIIGGLCISQLITLFLTPVLYLELEKLSERWNSRKNP